MFGNVPGFIGAFSTAALDAAGGREGCLASCLLRRRMRQRGLESLFESGPAVSGVLSAAASDAAAGPRKVGWRRVCCGARCGSGVETGGLVCCLSLFENGPRVSNVLFAAASDTAAWLEKAVWRPLLTQWIREGPRRYHVHGKASTAR